MKINKIGFTGTRKGMTAAQHASLEEFLSELRTESKYYYFHHGDCVGADAEFHKEVRSWIPFDKHTIVIHPPTDNKLRAYCSQGNFVEPEAVKNVIIREPQHYFVRNRAIVDETSLLMATPSSMNKTGGTWMTISYAIKKDKPVYLIKPDGEIVENYK